MSRPVAGRHTRPRRRPNCPARRVFHRRRGRRAVAARGLLFRSPDMLRITRREGADGAARLHVEGRLGGDGVHELAVSCEAHLAARQPLVLELQDVTFVDGNGLGLLHEVRRRGAVLECSPFLGEMLSEHTGGNE
jgi:ABC-type transporter Mla MlaB component